MRIIKNICAALACGMGLKAKQHSRSIISSRSENTRLFYFGVVETFIYEMRIKTIDFLSLEKRLFDSFFNYNEYLRIKRKNLCVLFYLCWGSTWCWRRAMKIFIFLNSHLCVLFSTFFSFFFSLLFIETSTLIQTFTHSSCSSQPFWIFQFPTHSEDFNIKTGISIYHDLKGVECYLNLMKFIN